MYSGSAQGVVERVINVRYYYYNIYRCWDDPTAHTSSFNHSRFNDTLTRNANLSCSVFNSLSLTKPPELDAVVLRARTRSQRPTTPTSSSATTSLGAYQTRELQTGEVLCIKSRNIQKNPTVFCVKGAVLCIKAGMSKRTQLFCV